MRNSGKKNRIYLSTQQKKLTMEIKMSYPTTMRAAVYEEYGEAADVLTIKSDVPGIIFFVCCARLLLFLFYIFIFI